VVGDRGPAVVVVDPPPPPPDVVVVVSSIDGAGVGAAPGEAQGPPLPTSLPPQATSAVARAMVAMSVRCNVEGRIRCLR
jgi:hypothetical protein